jgi:hypothetical protein
MSMIDIFGGADESCTRTQGSPASRPIAGDSGRAGAAGEVSLDGSEREVMTGLKKPVGVLAVGDRLFVSDQDLNQIVSAPRSDPAAYSVLLTSRDLIGSLWALMARSTTAESGTRSWGR